MDYVRAVNALGSMREPAFLILAVLAQEDLHGYGIVKKVESLSDGEVHLAFGTLYGALDRLGDKGLVLALILPVAVVSLYARRRRSALIA